VTRIGFPAGEGVQLEGWDGIVGAEDGTAYVPQGMSAWEMGTNRNIKGKADEDYEKRRRTLGGIDPSQSTFVFVTPRRWGGKDEWIATRQAEGLWRDVRAYSADDLEAWLEQAPAVHIWISVLVGKQPEAVADISNHWADWSEATRPALSRAFVLAGRTSVVERVHKWLREESGVLALQGESREEALAVFAASLLQLPEDESIAHLSRTVVVRDRASWDQLIVSEQPLVLIPLFESRDAQTRATRRGHRVVIPLGRSDSAFPTTLNIPQLSRAEAVQAVTALGLTEDSAKDIVALARRSLTACRRTLAVSPEVQRPEWARPSEARSLLPALLAGSWNGSSEGDRDSIAALAQAPYRELTTILVRWSNETDPPVRRVGDAWFLVSREDAWLLLDRYLVREDFERFEEVALSVLSTPDPRFDLPERERWMAGALGRGPQHSELLHEGLADSLAFMGARGTTLIAGGTTPSNYAARIVRRLLDSANRDWRIWASLSRILPLIAEAAPDVFFDAVEAGIERDRPILALFASEGDPLFSSSPHTGLLWALEVLAWSPEHLARAAIILARLARLDPGGKLTNRPSRSLREVILLWHPQTSATLEQRMRVIDNLRRAEPDVAWQLIRELLPKLHDVGGNTPTPRWREWAPESSRSMTVGEHLAAIHEVARRAVEDVGENGARWKDLTEALAALPIDDYRAVTERLNQIDPTQLRGADRAGIWNALRMLVAQHRSFADAQWALPRDSVEQLAALLPRFEPDEAEARYGWLFSSMPWLPEGQRKDVDAYKAALTAQRLDAVRRIYSREGLRGLLELSARVEQPEQIGATLGQSELGAGTEEQEFLRDELASDDEKRAALAHGFAVARSWARGREWGEALLEAAAQTWTPRARARLLTCLPRDGRTWDLVDRLDGDTQREYWQRIGPYGIPAELVERAARNFLEHGRPYAAVDLIAFHAERTTALSPVLIAEALERSLQVSWRDDPPHSSFSHHVSTLLDRLESSEEFDVPRLARLEWNFLPVVGRHERPPKLLHRALAETPDFFATVVSYVYRAEGEEPREISEEEKTRAHLGYDLLDTWHRVPGTTDGNVDYDALKNWIRQAREATAAIGRGAIGDQLIGQVLASAPKDPDGTWPHAAVRQVIEDVASSELERGLQVAVYNNRGVFSRAIDAGGSQERRLAEQYAGYAAAVADRWPRTAAVLRRIAEGYRAEARSWDEDTALREEREAGSARLREREWLRTNLPKLRHLAGKWVAVEGTEIVAEGDDAASVAAVARERGIASPFLYRIPLPEDSGRASV
jgi:hypothetical protein